MAITVFVADDHAVVRDGLISLLQNQDDIEVIGSAANGADAVKEVKTLRPDIVLMDISMPILSGIEAADRITATSKCTQVIILSMHKDSEHIYRALRAGAKGYLLKESAGQEVMQAVRQVYAGNRYLSREVSGTIIDGFVDQREDNFQQPSLELLSIRELETLQMVVDGKSSIEIAKFLGLSPKTIETYRSRVMDKLRIRDIPNLVKFAIAQGLTTVEQ
jgi:DNA-binding NarL/FixJ family response regulator